MQLFDKNFHVPSIDQLFKNSMDYYIYIVSQIFIN